MKRDKKLEVAWVHLRTLSDCVPSLGAAVDMCAVHEEGGYCWLHCLLCCTLCHTSVCCKRHRQEAENNMKYSRDQVFKLPSHRIQNEPWVCMCLWCPISVDHYHQIAMSTYFFITLSALSIIERMYPHCYPLPIIITILLDIYQGVNHWQLILLWGLYS